MITPSFGLTATERVLPKLALDFTTASLDSRITFTRTTGASNPATYVNSSGVITAATNNQPRFDYDPVTLVCKGLLIEESRQNLFLYSNNLTDAYWTKFRATASSVAGTAPDGSTTVQLITEDTTTNSRGFLRVSVLSNQAYTHTVYAKPNGRNWICLENLGYYYAYFDIANGVVGTTSGGAVASISNAGNGWYRCSMTGTSPAGTMSLRANISNSGSSLSYTGDGVSGVFFFGAQFEVGAFATSYIPTTSAALTRNADVATMTGTNFSDWFNASEGTFVCWSDNASTGYRTAFIADDGTSNNKMFVQTNITANGQQWASRAAATWVVTLSNQGWTNNGKTAACYKLNDYYYSTSGAASTGDTSATVPTVNRLVFGAEAAANYLNGHVQKFMYFPQRLTNAEIQANSK